MATQVQNRRGSTAEHSTFTGAVGEVTVDTDKDVVVVHDGTTAGGYPQMRENGSNSALALGSAATPSLKFTGDTNTGIYSPGADQVAISTNSSERIRIGANGEIGIGGANYGTSGQVLTSAGSGAAPTWQTPAAGNTDKIEEGNSSAEVIDTGSDGRFVVTTEGTERLRVDSSGRLGLGTSSPSYKLHVSGDQISLDDSSGTATLNIGTTNNGNARLKFWEGGIGGGNGYSFGMVGASNALSIEMQGTGEIVRFASDGKVGIGTTSPAARLHVSSSGTGTSAGSNIVISARSEASGRDAAIQFADGTTSAYVGMLSGAIYFADAGSTERARIDSSGRLLVGTSSSPASGNGNASYIVVQGFVGTPAGAGFLSLQRGETATNITTDEGIGVLSFNDSNGNAFADITCRADANAGVNDYPGRLVFSTTADGASSPTERMRITQNGGIRVNCTAELLITGETLSISGLQVVSRSNDRVLVVNRDASDGTLVEFRQDGATEGTISVSGTTVSYNGAHLSRWSQLPGGVDRTEILRGTVLSNIDEMCEWGEEDNEQLNRMKVSDVEGDKNVSGVFQAWDDDDDTYTNDFYCAMTGDFIIRIAQGVTVERGDLLMSAGDGTAKPQDDDIIRSKTIAKVTSTNVSCTYEDGSYCVPCVLMAC